MKFFAITTAVLFFVLPLLMLVGFTLAIWQDGRWGLTALMLIPFWIADSVILGIGLKANKKGTK